MSGSTRFLLAPTEEFFNPVRFATPSRFAASSRRAADSRRAAASAAGVMLAVGLVACSSTDEPAAPPDDAASGTEAASDSAAALNSAAGSDGADTSDSAAGSDGADASDDSDTSDSASSDGDETSDESAGPDATEPSARETDEADVSESAAPTSEVDPGDFNESVADAYEIFRDIAPASLFARFDGCDPVGSNDTYNCSGPEVGQVQFFKSKTKASQTTQVLTELRSSEIVEDSGDKVVGWSTLGTTAILTSVDRDKGLVVQQMISTDQDDPEEKLRELGLQ